MLPAAKNTQARYNAADINLSDVLVVRRESRRCLIALCRNNSLHHIHVGPSSQFPFDQPRTTLRGRAVLSATAASYSTESATILAAHCNYTPTRR
jgi:hypothetical protein